MFRRSCLVGCFIGGCGRHAGARKSRKSGGGVCRHRRDTKAGVLLDIEFVAALCDASLRRHEVVAREVAIMRCAVDTTIDDRSTHR